jgi:hypothetical protein
VEALKTKRQLEVIMDQRPGCLSGLLKLFFLDTIYKWGQRTFGFQQGGCLGCGCGTLMLIAFIIIFISIITGTNWFRIGF